MSKQKQIEAMDTDVYFSLDDLMHLGSMSGAVLLTGQNCLDSKVVRTNVVEVANLLDWVGPNELVISSGYSFRDHAGDLAALLAELQKKGVAALCLKPRRFRDGLPEQVVAQAAQLGFPLIQLPMAAVFANIVHESMEAILNKETQAFRLVQDRMEQLLDALWKEENPEECLHVVEEMLGNPVMIFDSESEFILSPKSRDLISQPAQEELMKQLYCRNGQSTFRLSGKPGVPVHIFDVSAQSGIRIILLEYYNPLRHVEQLILRRTGHILALEMKNFLAIKKIRRKYKQQFMEDWLGGRLGDTVSICVAAHAEGYTLSAECNYRVAIVNLNTSQTDAGFMERDVSIIRHIIRNLNSNILFNVLEGKLLLVFQDGPSSENSFRELSTLTAKFNYIMDKGEMSFCISDPHSIQGIAEAYDQAKKISQISARCGLREQVITHDKLGILYLLSLLPADAAIQRFRTRFLSPLKEYDQQHKSALTETLRVYLETGCNTMQTAKRLHAHYNTVAYRLANAEKILSLSVGDVETQLQLRIAYKLDLIL